MMFDVIASLVIVALGIVGLYTMYLGFFCDPPNKQKEDEDTISIFPPKNYIWKIQNFSQLSNLKASYIESNDFDVSGCSNNYKWRLRLDLNPIKNKNLASENRHINLYLIPSKPDCYDKVWANFTLFVYNQLQDNYLTFREDYEMRGMQTEWGFNELLPLDVFSDPSKGFLINDCCVFGAEVHIYKVYDAKNADCTCLEKDLGHINTYTWYLPFFKMMKEESHKSPVFDIAGHKWSLLLYPNGKGKEKRRSLSISLNLEDSETLNPGDRLNVECVVLAKDQVRGNDHKIYGSKDDFSASTKSWDFTDFITLSELYDTSKGYMHNGAVTLKVEISHIAVTKVIS